MPSGVVVSDLIRSSMRLIGVLATGETPSADETADGVSALNDILENLSLEPLSMWQQADVTAATVPGQGSYTIGAGGNINAPRPVRINSARVTFNGVDFPLEIVSLEEFANIPVKATQSQIPNTLTYSNDNPLGVVSLYPVPSAAITLSMIADRVLTTPVTANTALIGPPGYAKMLRYVLAVELAPEYGIDPPVAVLQLAANTKADFKRANIEAIRSYVDDALTSASDYTYILGAF
jgi:hypothetical protein